MQLFLRAKKIFSILFVIVLLLSVGVTTYIVQQRQDQRGRAAGTNLPVGNFDYRSCTELKGWACDIDNNGQPIDVHMYADGPDGEVFLGGTRANLNRRTDPTYVGQFGQSSNSIEDSISNNTCGGQRDIGWKFTDLTKLKPNTTYTLRAYAINAPSGPNPELTNFYPDNAPNVPAPKYASTIRYKLNCNDKVPQKGPVPLGLEVDLDKLQYNNLYRDVFLRRGINYLTPGNVMKWEIIHPQPNQYNFAPTDYIVDFAQQNGIEVNGHSYVWYFQNAQWLIDQAPSLSRDQMIEIMRQHIYTVMGRYKGKIKLWDVVNEAWDENGNIRLSGTLNGITQYNIWYQRIGPDYIKLAFKFAREADPNAILQYNDFLNYKWNANSQAAYNYISQMKAEGYPIDSIGFQMHIGTHNRPTNEEFIDVMQRFAQLGLQVRITEIDIINETNDEAGRQKQVQTYSDFSKICKDYSHICKGFTTWGVADGWTENWLNDKFPLLFDNQFIPKEEYFTVLNNLGYNLNPTSTPTPIPVTGTISASPNPCSVQPGSTSCQTTVTFNQSSGHADVCRRVNGGPYEFIVTNTFPTLPGSRAQTIELNKSYTYHLLTTTSSGQCAGSQLAQVSVSAVAPTPTPDPLPHGALDPSPVSNCTELVGWACDASNYDTTLTIDLYQNISGGQTKLGSYPANVFHDAGATAACAGRPNHGFRIPFPANLKDGQYKSLAFYALNIPDTSKNKFLGDIALTCAAPTPTFTPTPTPYPFRIEGYVFQDNNFNFVKDTNEPGLSNFSVAAFNSQGQIVTPNNPYPATNSNGYYSMGIPSGAGTYTIHSSHPPGFKFVFSALANPFVKTGVSLTSTQPVTIVNIPAIQDSVNIPPYGSHSYTSCQVLSGWTCDTDDVSRALEVHFYKDSGGANNYLGKVLASKFDQGVVDRNNCYGTGNHAFEKTIDRNTENWSSLFDGQPHTIKAYPLNISDPNVQVPPLTQGPNASISITCTAPTATPVPPTLTFTPSPTRTPTPIPPTNTPTLTRTPTSTPTHTPTSAPTGTPAPLAGDVNNDRIVNILDYSLVLSNFGKTGATIPGASITEPLWKVDIYDYTVLLKNFTN